MRSIVAESFTPRNPDGKNTSNNDDEDKIKVEVKLEVENEEGYVIRL